MTLKSLGANGNSNVVLQRGRILNSDRQGVLQHTIPR